jgi:hypothetical protein
MTHSDRILGGNVWVEYRLAPENPFPELPATRGSIVGRTIGATPQRRGVGNPADAGAPDTMALPPRSPPVGRLMACLRDDPSTHRLRRTMDASSKRD